MSSNFSMEPMVELFIFESEQLIEAMERVLLDSEKANGFSSDAINEIFRAMHTIKGSAGMMMYNNISSIAHSIEDLFYVIREEKPTNIDVPRIIDIVLTGIDFIKTELYKVKNKEELNGNSEPLVNEIKAQLNEMKSDNKGDEKKEEDPIQQFYIPSASIPEDSNYYKSTVFFQEDVGMENIRAFGLVHSIQEVGQVLYHEPENLFDNNEECSKSIIENGFKVYFSSKMAVTETKNLLSQTVFLKDFELEVIQPEDVPAKKEAKANDKPTNLDEAQLNVLEKEITIGSQKQSFISVNVEKLDELMNLVGELVISESMVSRNPEVLMLGIESFNKAARQLRKITEELQDSVMSLRLVPLSNTFQKMHRIVRDMTRKLQKEAELQLIGEETEVDKNIIEHIGDPLMHLIRNAMDHGLEDSEQRETKGKSRKGKITLEAKNSGGEVWILVKDDGKGLDREKIISKAEKLGLMKKLESEMTDREIFSFIFAPGFSTKDEVSVYSGRGVGMDVVTKNIESIGGSIFVDSEQDKGTTISIRIPLTLAIIDGMVISVGSSTYIVPTVNIKESFKANAKEVIHDNEGNEMIMIRGVCYPIMRLHKNFNVNTRIKNIEDGIIMMVEDGEQGVCLFADELIGEQQVVVKPLPKYIKKVNGIGGCTLLGDGSISLILDVASLLKNNEERAGETNG